MPSGTGRGVGFYRVARVRHRTAKPWPRPGGRSGTLVLHLKTTDYDRIP